MPLSTLRGYPRIGGVIGYGPVGGSGMWKLQERYALVDDFYDDVSLLLHMNGANGSTTFLDSSRFGHVVTANGNAQVSTAQSRFGGASAAFDGNGDFLSVPNNAAFSFGSGDFTIELWLYLSSTAQQAIIVRRSTGFVTGDWVLFHIGTSPGRLAFISQDYSADGTNSLLEASSVVNQNTWHHVAIVRFGNDWALYVDGASVSTRTTATTLGENSLGINVGRDPPTGGRFFLNGRIDELRITKRARYTAAFTPSPRAFIP